MGFKNGVMEDEGRQLIGPSSSILNSRTLSGCSHVLALPSAQHP